MRRLSSHVSFNDSRSQAPTRLSQIVPQQQLKSMSDLDKEEEEVHLANTHRRRNKVSKMVKKWFGGK
jgi:hypothetical protein